MQILTGDACTDHERTPVHFTTAHVYSVNLSVDGATDAIRRQLKVPWTTRPALTCGVGTKIGSDTLN